MSEETKSKEIETKKYIILRDGNHFELDEPGREFVLSRTRTGCKPFAVFKNVKKDLHPILIKSVKLGILDFTDDPETYQPPEVIAKSNAKQMPRYTTEEFTHKDVKSGSRIPKAPQFSNGTMLVKNASPIAVKVIKMQAHIAVKRINGAVSQLGKDEAAKVLNDMYALESAGMNPAFHSRREVMDVIQEMRVRLGINKAAISSVSSVPDDSGNDTVARL